MRSSARIQRRGRDSDKLTGGSERGVHAPHYDHATEFEPDEH